MSTSHYVSHWFYCVPVEVNQFILTGNRSPRRRGEQLLKAFVEHYIARLGGSTYASTGGNHAWGLVSLLYDLLTDDQRALIGATNGGCKTFTIKS